MKTKQLLLFIVAVTFAANLFATELPKMSIIPLTDTRALLTVKHSAPNTSEVTITSDMGEIVYYKKSKKEEELYKKIFDLSQLENGNYTLTVKTACATMRNELKVYKGTISLQNHSNEMKPYFATHKNDIILTYLNFETQAMTLRVYKSSKIVFSETLGNEFAMHRKLNITALNKGDYDIQLFNKDTEYWFSFTR